MIIFRRLDDDCMKSCRIFAAELGKMPEWSIGPHSKCGERATVPRVRIPVFPQNGRCKSRVYKIYAFFCAQFLFLPVYRICFSEKEMQQFQKESLSKRGCHEPSFRGRFGIENPYIWKKLSVFSCIFIFPPYLCSDSAADSVP